MTQVYQLHRMILADSGQHIHLQIIQKIQKNTIGFFWKMQMCEEKKYSVYFYEIHIVYLKIFRQLENVLILTLTSEQ